MSNDFGNLLFFSYLKLCLCAPSETLESFTASFDHAIQQCVDFTLIFQHLHCLIKKSRSQYLQMSQTLSSFSDESSSILFFALSLWKKTFVSLCVRRLYAIMSLAKIKNRSVTEVTRSLVYYNCIEKNLYFKITLLFFTKTTHL